MTNTPPSSRSSGSNSSVGLLLRVTCADGTSREMYLAHGLTIGRSQANTIQLPDDPQIERNHARVEVAEDGSASVVCLNPTASISVDGSTQAGVSLRSGQKFRIGANQFECVSGLQIPIHAAQTDLACCPYCEARVPMDEASECQTCPACGQAVMSLRGVAGFGFPIVVPKVFKQEGGEFEYEVQRYVARGGMGLVLAATRKNDSTPVAIKLLLPEKGVSRRSAQRFSQEIDMMQRICHPHVVRLLGHGRQGHMSFLIMEWIEGRSLRQLMADYRQQKRPIAFDVACQWLQQVGKGLAALHAAGIVHRDLKPSNILITNDWKAKLSDLGIARSLFTPETELTMTGETPGTLGYMAPEQLSSPDLVDGRTDLYALGATFYELLTGLRPVGAWRPASAVNSTVPAWFDTVLAKLLAPAPEERYADIHEVLADLKQSAKQSSAAPSNKLLENLTTAACSTWNQVRSLIADTVRNSAENATPKRLSPEEEYRLLLLQRNSADQNSKIFGIAGLFILIYGSSILFRSTSSGGYIVGWATSVSGLLLFCMGMALYCQFKGLSPALGMLGIWGLLSAWPLVFIPDRMRRRLGELERQVSPQVTQKTEFIEWLMGKMDKWFPKAAPPYADPNLLPDSLSCGSMITAAVLPGCSLPITIGLAVLAIYKRKAAGRPIGWPIFALIWAFWFVPTLLPSLYISSQASLPKAVPSNNPTNNIAKESQSLPSGIVKSSGGGFQLTLPPGWRVNKEVVASYQGDTLGVMNDTKALYIASSKHNRKDITSSNIDGFAKQICANLETEAAAKASAIGSLSIDNQPARRFEITVVQTGVRYVHVYTVCESEECFFLIDSWTTPSNYELHMPEMMQVTTSFKMTGKKATIMSRTSDGERRPLPQETPADVRKKGVPYRAGD